VGAIAVGLLGYVPSTALRCSLCALAGAAVGPCFALALAVLGKHGASAQGSAAFTASFSVGSILGPVVTALAMRIDPAHLTFGPAVATLLGVAAFAGPPTLRSKTVDALPLSEAQRAPRAYLSEQVVPTNTPASRPMRRT